MGTEVSASEPVPFLPSLEWYGRYTASLLAGSGEDEARRCANEALRLPAKEFTRATLSPGVRLKVPVEGGSSAKRLPPKRLIISGHGDWRHTHLGAISAIFGRYPFYRTLAEDMERVYSLYGEAGLPLAEFSQRLHFILKGIILPEELTAAFPSLPLASREKGIARGRELLRDSDPSLSLLSMIMNLGPETLLPILALSSL